MHVRIEPNWATQGHLVWFYERSPLRILRLDKTLGMPPVWEMSSEDATSEPTLLLPNGALEALLAEAEAIIPASHATERHLLDSIDTRDRLFGLVEKLTDEAPTKHVVVEELRR